MDTQLTQKEAERFFEDGDGRGAIWLTTYALLGSCMNDGLFTVHVFQRNPLIVLGLVLSTPTAPARYLLRGPGDDELYQLLVRYARRCGQAVAA